MTSTLVPKLTVRAQLTLEIDDARTSLTADGSEITVRTDDVASLVSSAGMALAGVPGRHRSLRRVTGSVARALDEYGLSARVVDRRGTVVQLGRDCATPGARLLFTDPHVRLGSPRALLAAGADIAKASPSTARRAGAAIGVVGAALAGIVWWRRAR